MLLREGAWVAVPDAKTNSRVQHDLILAGHAVRQRLRLSDDPIQIRPGRNHELLVRVMGFAGTIMLDGKLVDVAPRYLPEDEAGHWRDLLGRLAALQMGVAPVLVDPGDAAPAPSSFLDHIALAYAEAIKRAARRGPVLTYGATDETGLVLQGRLSVPRQVRSLLRGLTGIEQTVSRLGTNNAHHALLAWAIGYLASKVRSGRVAAYVASVESILPPSNLRMTPTLAAQAKIIRRQDAHWAPAIGLAAALYESSGIGAFGSGPRIPGIVFDTWRLFEGLVRHVVRRSLADSPETELRFAGRQGKTWLRSSMGSGPRRLDPDCVITLQDRPRLIVDAKNKSVGDSEAAGRAQTRDDFYQMQTYLLHYQCPTGVLMYPVSSPASEGPSVLDAFASIAANEWRILCVGLHVPTILTSNAWRPKWKEFFHAAA